MGTLKLNVQGQDLPIFLGDAGKLVGELLLQTRIPGDAQQGGTGTADASDSLDRAEYAIVAQQLRNSPIRGTGCFHFCTMDDMMVEIPTRLCTQEQDMKNWNLLWISTLLGGGFLPADERGKGLAVLGSHGCSIPYENSRDIAYSGWISGEVLQRLPLRFEQENGVTTIAVS